MRHPAQVEHHEDDLPLGQDQQQEAGRQEGEGYAVLSSIPYFPLQHYLPRSHSLCVQTIVFYNYKM